MKFEINDPWIKNTAMIIAILSSISVIAGIKYGFLESFRAVFGLAFIFVPGLVWSYVFFDNDAVNIQTRAAVSIGLSIILAPIALFYLNKITGMPINLINSIIVNIALILIGFALVLIKPKLTSLFPKKN